MDVPAPGFGAVCGSCPPGFTREEQKCYGMCTPVIIYPHNAVIFCPHTPNLIMYSNSIPCTCDYMLSTL